MIDIVNNVVSKNTQKSYLKESASFLNGFFMRGRKHSLGFSLSGAIAVHRLKPKNFSHTPLLKIHTLERRGFHP
jgi:hypothetical protein